MALINCPECGHQMSDTVKKCPNCGYKQPNIFQYKGFKNLYIGLLLSVISLGLLILAMPTMSGFSMSSEIYLTEDDFWYGILEVVGSCILFFFGCKFFKRYTSQTNKIVLIFIVIAILGTAINMLCHGVKLKDDYFSYNENIENIENNPSDNSINSTIGEYEFVDSDNDTWVLILNGDETANLHIKNGREYYGTWEKWIDEIVWIRLPFDDAPRLNIKGDGRKKTSLFINDGFIYFDGTASKSKNPRMRLPITKVK